MFTKLNAQLEGEVRDDPFTRAVYSIDASLYRIEPRAVVLPRNADDVLAAVAFAREHGLPVIPRGAATGIAGGCLGAGLVIDTATLDRILEINWDDGWARCQPGVVQDALNRALAPGKRRLGPDTSTGNRATLGGMMGNNSSGAHSLRFGKMVESVLDLELVTAEAAMLHCGDLPESALRRSTAGTTREAEIGRTLARLKEDLADEIQARFPTLERRVSGYNLDELTKPGPVNLAKLVTGSEGTFGVATEMRVRLAVQPAVTAVEVLQFAELSDALAAVTECLTHDPYAVELIDHHIIRRGRQSPAMATRTGWLEGTPGGLLVVEFDGDSAAELTAKLERFEKAVGATGPGTSRQRVTSSSAVADIWALRKAGLGLLMSERSHRRALAFLEDAAVPVEHLGEFMAELSEIIRAHGRDAGFYGHAGAGCVHVRPMLNLRRPEDLDAMVAMMEAVSDRLLVHGGAVSGEHGDGLVRSWLNEKMFGPEVYAGFRELKRAFDPDGLMNPGKIVDAPPPTADLRIDPETPLDARPTCLDFSADGGFALAVEMCNGNAECRKTDSGVMCPSFHATGEEQDSTRGRATALQAILHGHLPPEEFSGEGLHRVMDLCLQCKGCKRECPSEVDMARLKAEFLYHYHRQHGYSLRDRIFGAVDTLSRFASAIAPLANWLQQTPPARQLLHRIGIHRNRRLPAYARQRFSRWLARHPLPAAADGDPVILFIDTWTEYNFPHLGQAAVRVLSALGCRLVVPPRLCCGRAQISKGMLDNARRKARRLVAWLHPYVTRGFTVVGLEPSCILTIRDEYRALCPGEETDAVSAACRTLDEYLYGRLKDGTLTLRFGRHPARVALHGHCHEKALPGTRPTLEVLRHVDAFEVDELDTGCCGMAGAFGYEREHYDVSMQVGETRLFPAVRALPRDTALVANGVSCRAQIEHGTGRRPLHLVEVLAAHLEDGGCTPGAAAAQGARQL